MIHLYPEEVPTELIASLHVCNAWIRGSSDEVLEGILNQAHGAAQGLETGDAGRALFVALREVAAVELDRRLRKSRRERADGDLCVCAEVAAVGAQPNLARELEQVYQRLNVHRGRMDHQNRRLKNLETDISKALASIQEAIERRAAWAGDPAGEPPRPLYKWCGESPRPLGYIIAEQAEQAALSADPDVRLTEREIAKISNLEPGESIEIGEALARVERVS